jgi:hypothetical protein
MATRTRTQQHPATSRTDPAQRHGGLGDLPAIATAVARHGLSPLWLARRLALTAAAHAGERALRVFGGSPEDEAYRLARPPDGTSADAPVVTDYGPVEYVGITTSPTRDGRGDRH